MRKADSMSAGWVDAMRRLAGGLILLLVMSFALVPAASAHGIPHDGMREAAPHGLATASLTPSQDAHVSAAIPPGMPVGHKSCDACPSCCGTGACPMMSATLASGPSVAVWLPEVSTAFGRGSSLEIPGLRSIPDTRPPRLDA